MPWAGGDGEETIVKEFEFFDVDVLDGYESINREIEEVKEKYDAHRYGSYVFDYPFIVSHLNVPPANIIDFGCGFGALDFYLAEKGYEVWAVDRDDTRWFMEQHPSIHFIHADLSGGLLRIEDGCWDYVIAASSIEHNEPGAMKRMFELALRLLKPEGKFIATLVAYPVAGWRHGAYCLNEETIEMVFGMKVDFSQFDPLFKKFQKRFNYPYLPFGIVVEK